MSWTPLNFGKHEGKTLPHVMFKDPDWFFWAFEDGVFEERGGPLREEAQRIRAKATSIRIPQSNGEPCQVEHRLFYRNHTSLGFALVPANRPRHEGSSATQRADHIDMSLPRRQKGYDKQGNGIFISSLKRCLFGSSKVPMSKQRCEAFFDDESNFHRNS